MSTSAALLTALVLVSCWALAAGVARYRQRRVNQRRERLRAQLAQLAAERRIQAAAQDAVRRMLAEARDVVRRDEPQ